MQSASEVPEKEEGPKVMVKVSPTTWKRLMALKNPGTTFNDVIAGLLDDADEALAEDTKA